MFICAFGVTWKRHNRRNRKGKSSVTKIELSRPYYLHRSIERDILRIADLEDALINMGARITGTPHARRVDRMQAIVDEIDDLRLDIERKRVRLVIARRKTISYMASVKDGFMRNILKLRHIDFLSWDAVARTIGGKNTKDSVRMAHDRFLRG